MKTLLVFMLAIAVLLFVDALPYVPSKPSKITIPLKKKSVTSRRSRKLDRRVTQNVELEQESPDIAYFGQLTFGHTKGGGKPQTFDILFDTGSADLWVMEVACNSAACQEKDIRYDFGEDTDYGTIGSHFGITYEDGDGANGFLGSTIVQIGSLASRQNFGLALTVNGFENKQHGVMGMALNVASVNNQLTLISNLLNDENNRFDAKQFSFKLGRNADGAESELTIGGTNPKRFSGELIWSDLSDDNKGHWTIPVDDILVNGQPLNFVGRNGDLDTGATRIYVPHADAEQIYANIKHEMGINGEYIIDCGIQVTISLRINGATWNIDSRDFVVRSAYAGDKCAGVIVGVNNYPPNLWSLGIPFLKNVYSVFDLGNIQVGLGKLV
jgi:hypothetical protein